MIRSSTYEGPFKSTKTNSADPVQVSDHGFHCVCLQSVLLKFD